MQKSSTLLSFETQCINDCIDFSEAKGLHCKHKSASESEGKVCMGAGELANLQMCWLLCIGLCLRFHSGTLHHKITLCAGKLHFVKFETQRINDCIDFIEAKGLHRIHNGAGEPEGKVRVVATGGGAYKFAELFQVSANLCMKGHCIDNALGRNSSTEGASHAHWHCHEQGRVCLWRRTLYICKDVWVRPEFCAALSSSKQVC